ncbi:MAG: hypothetical protein UHK60_11085 [Acutalibacteraceae bacterium]|nr:hypothetical protein [Acutalibacteraceae bacterium]
MTELEVLRMSNKHYENKEKKLIKWINERKDLAEENSVSDNYSINLAWKYYRKALKDVQKQMEVLERVKDD